MGTGNSDAGIVMRARFRGYEHNEWQPCRTRSQVRHEVSPVAEFQLCHNSTGQENTGIYWCQSTAAIRNRLGNQEWLVAPGARRPALVSWSYVWASEVVRTAGKTQEGVSEWVPWAG